VGRARVRNILEDLKEQHLLSFDSIPRAFALWRGSSEYREFAEVVAAQTRSFIKCCTLVQHAFTEASLERCLLAFEEEARDLNDEMLVEVCRSHNLRLVTHDGDFRHADIDILTANPAYL